jgi:anti-sigma factor RsiW
MSATTNDPPAPLDPSCARVRPQLSAYLDGELDPEARKAVDAELARCAGCRAELAALQTTLGGLGALKRPAPPAFLENVQKQIHTRSKGRFFRQRPKLFGRIPFEWLSLVMILAMLAYYLVTLQSSPTNVTPAP